MMVLWRDYYFHHICITRTDGLVSTNGVDLFTTPITMSDEQRVPEWRDIGEGKYQVCDDGRVMRVKTGKILKPGVDGGGYRRMCLRVNGKSKMASVHRLVALAFIPNPDDKYAVDHIDRDKLNNHVANLRWATRSENNINTAARSNTGFKHICRILNRHGKPAFRVHIDRGGKRVVQKRFPIKDRDESEVLAEAVAYRNNIYKEMGLTIDDAT